MKVKKTPKLNHKLQNLVDDFGSAQANLCYQNDQGFGKEVIDAVVYDAECREDLERELLKMQQGLTRLRIMVRQLRGRLKEST